MKYVGETKRIMKFCLADHRGHINNQDETQAINNNSTPQDTIRQN